MRNNAPLVYDGVHIMCACALEEPVCEYCADELLALLASWDKEVDDNLFA